MATATQMLTAGVILLGMSSAVGEHMVGLPTTKGLLAFVYLVAFGSLIAFSAYGYLLRHARPAVATSYAYVNPMVAMLLGRDAGRRDAGCARLRGDDRHPRGGDAHHPQGAGAGAPCVQRVRRSHSHLVTPPGRGAGQTEREDNQGRAARQSEGLHEVAVDATRLPQAWAQWLYTASSRQETEKGLRRKPSTLAGRVASLAVSTTTGTRCLTGSARN